MFMQSLIRRRQKKLKHFPKRIISKQLEDMKP